VDHECRTAQIGCVQDKKLLTDIMVEALAPIRARRVEIDRDPGIVWEALRRGNAKARERAAETMVLVREAMQISYPELAR
jgi:tryptophanyl-tRNA synthetase